MTKKKIDIKQFRDFNNTQPTEQPTTSVPVSIKEKATASPVLNQSRSNSLTPKKTQRRSLMLPLSKYEIELTGMSVDPDECLIHPKNQRIQSLLTETNKRVVELKKSIIEEGQREPVLVRMVNVDGAPRYQILSGSRRRFAVSLLKMEDPSIKLRVWVADQIGEDDAEFLAKHENDNRLDVSSWERAQYIKSLKDSNPTWTLEVIAINEGIPLSTVSSLYSLSSLPIEWVSLFESPELLTYRVGAAIQKFLKSASKDAEKNTLSALIQQGPFANPSDLLKSLKTSVQSASKAKSPTKNQKIEISSGDQIKVKIGAHRSNPNHYIIDLYECTPDEYSAVYEFMKNTFKK